MGTVTRTYTFFENTTAFASEVNVNENTLYTVVNGNLNTANIAASGVGTVNLQDACVTVSKIATTSATFGSAGIYTISSTGLTTLASAGVTLNATGKPIYIWFNATAGATFLASAVNRINFDVRINRNGSAISSFHFRSDVTPTTVYSVQPSTLFTIDHNPPTGTVTYDWSTYIVTSSARLTIDNIQMFAYELK